MDPETLNRKVRELQERSFDKTDILDRMVLTIVDLDEVSLENILSETLDKFGLESLMFDYIFSLLDRVGVLWQTGTITPVHEHFFSNILRNKIIHKTAEIPAPTNNGINSFLLYLPEGEMHEIGLLFINYLIRKEGYKTIYLGQSVPLNDLLSLQQKYNAEYLVTSLVNGNVVPDPGNYIVEIKKHFPDTNIIFTGRLLEDVEYESNEIKTFRSLVDFSGFLKEI